MNFRIVLASIVGVASFMGLCVTVEMAKRDGYVLLPYAVLIGGWIVYELSKDTL
jgi:hypothetical protein